jgi:scyllo-inositol 2-dehydrogenase (NADP+)
MLEVGLVGYGLAGSVFHAPLIAASPRLSLAAIATSRSEAVPGVRLVRKPLAIVSDPELDLVVIATPNDTHFPLARAALEAGKHVVVDKPFALTSAEADALIALAAEKELVLTAFHNRRWDGDFLTVRRLVKAGALGELVLCELSWDRFRPAVKPGWKEGSAAGGLLIDLGPHLIDQALQLFGRPEALSADIATQREGAVMDDYFDLTLHYGSARVVLSACNLLSRPRPRFAVHGTKGSFVKYGIDTQEGALKAGASPHDPGFGEDAPNAFGIFTDAHGRQRAIPTERGLYSAYYDGVAAAILDGAPPPVDARDARGGLRIIELARQSAREGRRLSI